MRILADSEMADLEKPGLNRINDNYESNNKTVNSRIKKIMLQRKSGYRSIKAVTIKK